MSRFNRSESCGVSLSVLFFWFMLTAVIYSANVPVAASAHAFNRSVLAHVWTSRYTLPSLTAPVVLDEDQP